METNKTVAEQSNENADGQDEPKMTVTDRGFKHGAVITNAHNDTVRTYESSLAFISEIWLSVNQTSGDQNNVTISLGMEEARNLRDQLDYLIKNHYHIELYGELQERSSDDLE